MAIKVTFPLLNSLDVINLNERGVSEAILKEKHALFLKELKGLSLWHAKHILQCVADDLEGKCVINS